MDSCDVMKRPSEALTNFSIDNLINIIIQHGIEWSLAVSIALRYFSMKDDESNSKSD